MEMNIDKRNDKNKKLNCVKPIGDLILKPHPVQQAFLPKVVSSL